MKKLLFITGMIIFVLSSCSVQKSIYQIPRNPKVPLSKEKVSKIEDPKNLIGVGVSFSRAFTLIEGNAESKKEELSENGVLNVFDIFSGHKIRIPKKLPVLYQGGKLSGRQVFLNGAPLYQEMVGVITNVVVKNNRLIEIIVTVVSHGNKKTDLVFSLEEYRDVDRFYLKKKKARSFSESKLHNLGLTRDQYQNVILDQDGKIFYLLESPSGEMWFTSNRDRVIYLDRFFFNHQIIDGVEQTEAIPFIAGPEKMLIKKK